MASLNFSDLNDDTKGQLGCTLAALILTDSKKNVTSAEINAILKAAHLTVPNHWPLLFESALSGKNVNDLLTGGSGPAAGADSSSTQAAAAPAQAKKEEKKKEEKLPEAEPEVDMDMGDLFG